MEIFKSEIDDVNLLDICKNERDLLVRGIDYVYGIIENLYKKYSKSSYELYFKIKNPKEYHLYIRGASYMYNHRTRGLMLKMGVIYLKLNISYYNVGEEPTIYVDVIHANEDMLSGNTIIDIAKKVGNIIHARELSLIDASGLGHICYPKHFSMTTLYILSIGISWYNTKGFVSTYFDEEYRHNNRLLSLNIVDFLIAQREYTFKYMHGVDMNNIEEVEREKQLRMEKFIQEMNIFFDFFKNYDKQYPFFEDIGLFLNKEMIVQDVFTRIKLFILRVLPKNRTTIYTSLCSHLDWLFKNIDYQHIDEDESGEQTTSAQFNPNVMIYYSMLYYNMKNPIIPTPIHFHISRRKTARKRRSTGKSRKQTSSSNKILSRRTNG
jgi:hypothetical protein